MKLGLSISLLVALSGCATYVRVPEGAPPGPEAAERAWARVLSEHVDERGRIDFAGVADHRRDLDAFVEYVGAVSPRSDPAAFPTPAAVLAYYLNAYNALAMYDVIHTGIPPELYSIRFRFFYRNRFLMGGRRISLYDLENKIVRPIGDPRVHFALNCMARGCPRLPREQFQAGRLDAQLDAAARLFFSETRNVELQPEKKIVRFSEILSFYTKDFLARAPTLADYANRYRTEKLPTDWKLEFIPYDWKLNRQ
jgi:uncharacterized protein DUF547